jgi:hypothetical protein
MIDFKKVHAGEYVVQVFLPMVYFNVWESCVVFE